MGSRTRYDSNPLDTRATGGIAMGIKTRKLSYPMGEEILDVDLTQPISESVFGQIYQTLLDRCLIAFRGQSITREQYIAFMQRFGEPSLEQGGRLPDYP